MHKHRIKSIIFSNPEKLPLLKPYHAGYDLKHDGFLFFWESRLVSLFATTPEKKKNEFDNPDPLKRVSAKGGVKDENASELWEKSP